MKKRIKLSRAMPLWVYELLLFLSAIVIDFSYATIDINLSEYQYLANHLMEKECHKLVAALHFHNFELPKDLSAAGDYCFLFLTAFPRGNSGFLKRLNEKQTKRRLPSDIPCIDLLLHWNSSPREGRGQTHVEVCHRLNQIGREDLAEWLSKTVFHEISRDLQVALTAATEETTYSPSNITEKVPKEDTLDEAAWLKIDSFMEALAFCGLIVSFFGIIFTCTLCCIRNSKPRNRGYSKLRTNDN